MLGSRGRLRMYPMPRNPPEVDASPLGLQKGRLTSLQRLHEFGILGADRRVVLPFSKRRYRVSDSVYR